MTGRPPRAGILILLAGAGIASCGGDGNGPPGMTMARRDAGRGVPSLDGDGGTSIDPIPPIPHDAAVGGPPAGGTNDAGAGPDTGGAVDIAVPDTRPPPDVPPPPAFPREIDGRIVINEIMASNGLTLKNEAGLAGDWIELYNPTNQDVPLAGYALTDDLNVPAKAVIAAGVVLPARGHLLLWLDGAVDRGPTHLPLRLPGRGRIAGPGPTRRSLHQPAGLRRAGDRLLGRARARRIEPLGDRVAPLARGGQPRRERAPAEPAQRRGPARAGPGRRRSQRDAAGLRGPAPAPHRRHRRRPRQAAGRTPRPTSRPPSSFRGAPTDRWACA